MPAFKKGSRVYLPSSAQFAHVQRVVPKAEGPWAEQFYEVKVDGNDLCVATLQENALAPGTSAPHWSEKDLPKDHPSNDLHEDLPAQ